MLASMMVQLEAETEAEYEQIKEMERGVRRGRKGNI